MTNLHTLPRSRPGGSLPATVVQHAAGPIGARRCPATQAELQERLQCGGPTPTFDQVFHGGALQQHGAAAAGHEERPGTQGKTSILSSKCFNPRH